MKDADDQSGFGPGENFMEMFDAAGIFGTSYDFMRSNQLAQTEKYSTYTVQPLLAVDSLRYTSV